VTTPDEFRCAVESGDYARAQALLAVLPQNPATLQQVAEIRDLLAWAVQLARANRAHDAARLAELACSSAYRSRHAQSQSTWTIDA
jgi:hypothetical protein